MPPARVLGLALALLALPALARAEPSGGEPSGLTLDASLGGGGEMGLSHGKPGVLEIEAVVGYAFREQGLRPELALALGMAPDTNVGIRPGLRWSVPESPFQLRGALDAANARSSGWHWRWLLVGVAGELRVTSLFGFFGEVDTGVPLSSRFGVPLLLRAGASFRF